MRAISGDTAVLLWVCILWTRDWDPKPKGTKTTEKPWLGRFRWPKSVRWFWVWGLGLLRGVKNRDTTLNPKLHVGPLSGLRGTYKHTCGPLIGVEGNI